ncbi:g1361 [Coccomyxa elongata]
MNNLLRYLFLRETSTKLPLVNVVKLEGVIAPSRGVRGPQARRLISLDRVEPWLVQAFMPALKTFRPAAVAISLNSPGGSATQSELIYGRIRALAKKTKTPVYTFAEDVAASGAYWLLLAGDEVYANKTSLVGSIGVINATFGAVEAIKRLGIERRVYTAGKYKDLLDPFRPVRKDEEEQLQDVLADTHDSFKEAVREARGNKIAGVSEAELWSGRIWTGRQATLLGLTDGVARLEDKMREKVGDNVRFVHCSEPLRGGLADALGLSGNWGGFMGRQPDIYSVTSSVSEALLDEVQYRSMMARYGL